MAEKGVCPGCGQLTALLKSGLPYAHKGRTKSACPGLDTVVEPLTADELRLWEIPEASLQASILELAGWRGWEYAHWRPLMDRNGRWQTPVQGRLGAGWVDLTLVRPRDRRLVFAELKAMGGELSADQERVLGVLRALEVPPAKAIQASVEVFVWRPIDLYDAPSMDDSTIGRILR